jgi:hypothetical protein
MTKLQPLKKILLAALAVVILLGALPSSVLAAQDDLVRFRVINNADRGITIRLYATDGSGKAYYMRVDANATKNMTPIAGVYTYRLTACGVMVKGTVDLTRNLTWQNPQCGDKGGPGSKAPNTQDVGKILKLMQIKIVNRTGAAMQVWLDGPFQYVFKIPEGGSKTVSILKGIYEYGHYACGVLVTGNLNANKAATRTLVCP